MGDAHPSPRLLAEIRLAADPPRIVRVKIDPAARPPRVRSPDGGEDVFLEWDGVLDDAGRLRRCPRCGSGGLYRARSVPSVTPFVVILAFAGTVLALLGLADDPRVLAGLVVLLAVDVAILLLGRTWLVCYRCRSRYRGLPIARQHRRWDRRDAERSAADSRP